MKVELHMWNSKSALLGAKILSSWASTPFTVYWGPTKEAPVAEILGLSGMRSCKTPVTFKEHAIWARGERAVGFPSEGIASNARARAALIENMMKDSKRKEGAIVERVYLPRLLVDVFIC